MRLQEHKRDVLVTMVISQRSYRHTADELSFFPKEAKNQTGQWLGAEQRPKLSAASSH